MDWDFFSFLKLLLKIGLTPIAVFVCYVLIVDLKEMLTKEFSPVSKINIFEYLVMIAVLLYLILFL